MPDRHCINAKVRVDQFECEFVAFARRDCDVCEIEHAFALSEGVVNLRFCSTGEFPDRHRNVIFVFVDAALLPDLVLLIAVQSERAYEYCRKNHEYDSHKMCL